MDKTDNEVVAAFMGVKLIEKRNYDYWLMPDRSMIDYRSLDYSADWRLLMPVWYKFKALKIEGNRRHYVSHLEGIELAILHEGCAEACKLLAEGIRWYNSINQTVKK